MTTINYLLQGFTHSSRAETREPAARVFGLLAKDLEHTLFMETAEQVLKDTSDAVSEKKYIFEEIIFTNKKL